MGEYTILEMFQVQLHATFYLNVRRRLYIQYI